MALRANILRIRNIPEMSEGAIDLFMAFRSNGAFVRRVSNSFRYGVGGLFLALPVALRFSPYLHYFVV